MEGDTHHVKIYFFQLFQERNETKAFFEWWNAVSVNLVLWKFFTVVGGSGVNLSLLEKIRKDLIFTWPLFLHARYTFVRSHLHFQLHSYNFQKH